MIDTKPPMPQMVYPKKTYQDIINEDKSKQVESKYRIKIEQENLAEINNELKNIHVNIN